MSTAFSRTRYDAGQIAEGERFAFWQDTVGTLFPMAEIRLTGKSPFSGSISRRGLGMLAISDIRSVAQRVARSPRHIRRSADDFLELNFQIAGTGFLAQEGREAATSPGQFVLYDSTRPYEMRFDGPFRQLSVKFPKSMLKDRLWIVERLTAINFQWKAGPGRLFFTMLRALDRLDAVDDPDTISRLEGHALDLLATALRDDETTWGAAGPNRSRQRTFDRARQFILDNLGDPDLSIQAIADASRVSVRTLYSLFAAEGCAPGKWLQSARLEACRRDLEDGRQANRRIVEIAFARGFNDAAHFSRLFRAR